MPLPKCQYLVTSFAHWIASRISSNTWARWTTWVLLRRRLFKKQLEFYFSRLPMSLGGLRSMRSRLVELRAIVVWVLRIFSLTRRALMCRCSLTVSSRAHLQVIPETSNLTCLLLQTQVQFCSIRNSMLPLPPPRSTHKHPHIYSTQETPTQKGFPTMASRTNKAVLSWLAVLSPLSFRVDVPQLHCVVRSSPTIMQSLSLTKS